MYADCVDSSSVTQFVAFTTDKPPHDFVRDWRPIAVRFLRSGLRTITLAAVSDITDGNSTGVSFVSRNTWPVAAYRALFPTGAAAEMALGGTVVTQPGVFQVSPEGAGPVEGLQDRRGLALAFIASERANGRTMDASTLRAALIGALPNDHVVHMYAKSSLNGGQRYDLVVSVHMSDGDDEKELVSSATATATVLARVLADHVPHDGRLVLAGSEFLSLNQIALQ